MSAPHNLRAEARRLRERVRELEAYADRARLAPKAIAFGASVGALDRDVRVAQAWPAWRRPAWFRLSFDVPSDWPALAELWAELGGEGCWIEDGEALFGLNPMHRHCRVALEPGQMRHFELEVVPHGYQGAPVHEPKVNLCRLVAPDDDVRTLVFDLIPAIDVLDFLGEQGDREVGVRLMKEIDRALRRLDLPRSPSEAYLSRMAWLEALPVEGGSPDSPALQVRSSLWERPKFEAKPTELDDACRERIRAASQHFREACRSLAARYPGRGRLTLVGHAHLDVAWLWPLAETRRKSRRTFATACALADRYPHYVFGQSQAYLYATVEEDDPKLFERIKQHVKAGHIELLGGSWVEPDGNLASGESMVRQLLYGQRYFQSRFGRRCTVAWLPDTFGYAGNLPQLYVSAGMCSFMTTKLGWNETNDFPHDLYWWEGLDGTRVLSHTFKDIGPGADPRVMDKAWRDYRGKERAEVALQTYGRGDGGGGPTEEMVEGFARLAELPALPKLSLGTAASVFAELAEGDDVPVWQGEKYLEKHRGTYTSQVVIKRDVQRLGEALRAAERLWSMAWVEQSVSYPHEQFERLWKELLVHEFHDILPGSSIQTVNAEAAERLGVALVETERLQSEALEYLQAQEDQVWTVWNLGEAPMVLSGSVPTAEVQTLSLGGNAIRTQRVGDALAFVADGTLAPGERLRLHASDEELPFEGGVRASPTSLESDCLRVEFALDGTVASLRSLETGREFACEGAGKLLLHEDVPREYEAWDIDPTDLAHASALACAGEPTVLYEGPVEAALAFRLEAAGVNATLTYRLRYGCSRLDVDLSVSWHCRRKLLRLELPTTVFADTARYDTLFGSVPRPTHRNTSWDQAKYEVPAHTGVTLQDAAHGVQLIAPHGRHGFSVEGSKLSLSLLRAPIHPDPLADEGEHRFEYSIAVFDEVPVPSPVRQKLVLAAGTPKSSLNHVRHEDVRCTALKKAEDSDALIVRLYEAEGVAREVPVTVPNWVSQVDLCSILEEPEQHLDIERRASESTVRVAFGPYAVRTLRLSRHVEHEKPD